MQSCPERLNRQAACHGGWRTLLSCLLLACGTILAFLGTRTFLESYFGQSAAARTFRPAALQLLPPRFPPRADRAAATPSPN